MRSFREFALQSERLKQQLNQIAQKLTNLCSQPRQVKMPKTMKVEGRLPKAHEASEEFWLDPSSSLHRWLSQNGVDVKPGIVPPFAQGGVGRAYFVGDKVVKFTTDPVEANVAAMVAGLHGLPTAVISVMQLGNGIYAILQPYLDTQNVPNQVRKAADMLTAVIDDTGIQAFPASREERRELCLKTLQKYGGQTTLLPWMLMMMSVLQNLYQATGYVHNDAGPTNLAMHQGQVVIPDLGPNQTADFDPKATLDQIQRQRQSLKLPPHEPI